VETARSVLENVGGRLIEIRTARGWTQETCAEKLLVDVRLLRRIEAGRHNLTVLTLVAIAQRLGVPTRALFDHAALLSGQRRPGRPRRAILATAVPVPPAARPDARVYTRSARADAHAVSEKPTRSPRPGARPPPKKK
jgi:transcriptional regulator with XRE-family HTH domain